SPLTQKGSGHAPGDRADRRTPVDAQRILEHMVVSHYENNYGNAVRALNAVRRELAALDAGTPPYRLRGLKREELSLMGSVALHELYFGNLGGFRRTKCRTPSPRRSRRTSAAPVRGVASSSERRSRWRAAQDGCSSPTRAGRSGSGTRSRRITRRRPSTPRPCSFWTCTSTPTRWTSA